MKWFNCIHKTIDKDNRLTDYGLQQFILSHILNAVMITSSAPIAAVNEHSADPHYGPAKTGSSKIKRDDLVLIDLWAKQSGSGSVYADITWTAYTGSTVPEKHRAVFDVVRQGRDAALEFVRARVQAGWQPFGYEVR